VLKISTDLELHESEFRSEATR